MPRRLHALLRSSVRRCALLALTGCLLQIPAYAAEPANEAAKAPARGKISLTDKDAARIAIVVNDAAITNGDIAARYGMALLSSGLQDNPETRERVLPQIIRGLIEEQLQLQETRRQQIDVSETEINQALARIAKENNVPGGDVRAFFKSRGISPRTIEQQTRANIAWGKLIQRQLRPRVEISDDEVEDVVARLKANEGKSEYFVNELFLPVDDPDQDAAVHGFANKLLQQIKQTGAFGAIARQFSQGAGAQNGGEIGWVQQGTLAPEVDAALVKSKVGELVGPIKSNKGYHILAIRDARKITLGGDAGAKVKMTQIGHGVLPQNMKAAVADLKGRLKNVDGCASLEKQFPASEGWQAHMMEQSIADLPPTLAPIARNLKVGAPSDIDVQEHGVGFVVVCERTEAGSVNREAIYNGIGTERLENLARGLLRDLKRNAYIDMRI